MTPRRTTPTPFVCTHRLGDAEDGAVCTNPIEHQPGHGCTYASSTGSWMEAAS